MVVLGPLKNFWIRYPDPEDTARCHISVQLMSNLLSVKEVRMINTGALNAAMARDFNQSNLFNENREEVIICMVLFFV